MTINQKFFKYGVYFPATFAMNQPFYSALRQVEQSQYWSESELHKYQMTKLQQVLDHAIAHVPFYKKHATGSDFQSAWEVLQGLPAISKNALIDRPADFRSERPHRTLLKTTGGSTGQPVTIAKTATALGWEQAVTWRSYRWTGIDVGARQLRFWGTVPGAARSFRQTIKDLLLNRRRCSAFAFDEADLDRYVGILRRFRPAYCYGYVSMIAELASYINDNNIAEIPQLSCVITTSEVLTERQRERISKAFHCPVFNEYGCGEFGSIAHECQHGSLHICSENVLVEIFRDGARCKAGESGELVVTELNNWAMPLIRYRLGDFGALSDTPCACGRGLPRIQNIFGRAYDIVVNSAGKKYHGEFFMYILEDAKRSGLAIKGMQVRQIAIDALEIKSVCSEESLPSIERFFVDRLKSDFDKDVQVEFFAVDQVDREASGKMRVIIGNKELLDQYSK